MHYLCPLIHNPSERTRKSVGLYPSNMSNKVQVTKQVVSSDAFSFHFRFWKILGVYPVNGSNTLCIAIIAISASLPIGMTILLFKLDRLKDIFSNLSLNITTIAIILKFANILFRRRNILDINSWVHQLDTRATSAEEQECLRSAIHTARKMFHVTCTMFTGAVILGELGALLSHEKTLVCSSWYPFDWHHSTWKYWIAHVHQIVVFVIYILQDVSNDTFPAIYMLVLTAHVKTLNIRIRRLALHATESWQATNEELRQCIKDQQMLVE